MNTSNDHLCDQARVIDRIDPQALQRYLDLGFDLPDQVNTAVFKRQNEFAMGRLCAMQALTQIGLPENHLIRRDPERRPQWPPGITGSISHTDHYATAMVAHKSHVTSLGIDIETMNPMMIEDAGIWDIVITPEESHWLKQHPSVDRCFFYTLIFSAKEAFYKCIHPLVGISIDFQEVMLQAIDLDKQTYTISFKAHAPSLEPIQSLVNAEAFSGQWQLLESGSLLYTQVQYATQ